MIEPLYSLHLYTDTNNHSTIMLSVFIGMMILQLSMQISFILGKKGVYIPEDSHYLSTIFVQRQNAELIPINMSVQTTISNAIPSYNNYFDYFHLLTPEDITCYLNSVNNKSYLYPCAFLNSKNTLKRSGYVQSERYNQSIEEINNMNFSFIIDNTLFPYPSGAYGFDPLKINIDLDIDITVSPSYQNLGERLVFITATAYLIFITIITILICKTRNINKKMENSNLTQNERNHLESVMNRQGSDSSSSEGEESSAKSLRQKFLEVGDESEIAEIEEMLNQRRSIKPFREREKGSIF